MEVISKYKLKLLEKSQLKVHFTPMNLPWITLPTASIWNGKYGS